MTYIYMNQRVLNSLGNTLVLRRLEEHEEVELVELEEYVLDDEFDQDSDEEELEESSNLEINE